MVIDMTTTPRTAKDIFVELVGTVPADQWDKRLDEACAGDEELRNRVRALLRAHAEPASYLEQPAIASESDTRHLSPDTLLERPGTVIGPYKLLQQIGEGGMGVVFMAEQTRPVKRTVALKIIKPGMDTRQVIARFEAERQALAMMDHPNIARVLDAGTTGEARVGEGETGRGGEPDYQASPRVSPSPPLLVSPSSSGRPYFVMDLVKGIPITDYCDQQHLTVRQRLELFTQVCHAVQHAHQKGIIHRDLKRSNVLVQGTGSFFDDAPQPADVTEKAQPTKRSLKKVPAPLSSGEKPLVKVIDFGVAKATEKRLTERTMFTQCGQIVGTFEYMSPEQARFNQLDVDTRVRCYS